MHSIGSKVVGSVGMTGKPNLSFVGLNPRRLSKFEIPKVQGAIDDVISQVGTSTFICLDT